MALYNNVGVVTATTGTGTVTLGTVINSSYMTFAEAGVTNGAQVSYTIIDGTNIEIGYGTYTSSGTTMSRDTVLMSKIAGTAGTTKLTLSGTAEVRVTVHAQDIPPATVTTFANVAGRNGGLEVWQRGTSIAVAASTTAYTADGWYLATGTNQASVVARQAGLVNTNGFAARVQRNNGQTGTGTMRFAFPLDTDELIRPVGNTIQLIFTVRAGANWSPTSGTLTYNIYFGTAAAAKRAGSAYTGETNPITGSINLTAGGSAVQVAAISTSTIGTVAQAEIQFSWIPTGTAGTNDWFEIDDLDMRTVPTGLAIPTLVFESTDFVMDLTRCLRHYEKSYDYSTAPGTATVTPAVIYLFGTTPATGNYYGYFFMQQKRAQPTVTYYSYNGTSGRSTVAFGADNAASSAIAGSTSTIFHVVFNNSGSNLGAGSATVNWAADASI